MVISKTDYRFSCVWGEKGSFTLVSLEALNITSWHTTRVSPGNALTSMRTMKEDKTYPLLQKGASAGGFCATLLIKTLAQLLKKKPTLHLAHWASTVKRLSPAVVKLYDFPCCLCLQASDITEDDESSFGSVLRINTTHLSSLKRGKVCWLCVWV